MAGTAADRPERSLSALIPPASIGGINASSCWHIYSLSVLPSQIARNREVVEVQCKAADYLHKRARYEQTETLYRRAIHLGELMPGCEHSDLGRALDGLAFLSGEQGQYTPSSSQRLYERASGAC